MYSVYLYIYILLYEQIVHIPSGKSIILKYSHIQRNIIYIAHTHLLYRYMSRLQPFGFVGTDRAADPAINESSLYSGLTLFNLLLAPLHYYYYRRCTAPKYHANTITLNRYALGNARCCTASINCYIVVCYVFIDYLSRNNRHWRLWH